MISFFKRLLSRPSIEEQLKEFGGEESPYITLSKHRFGDATPDEGESIVFSGRPAGQTFSCYRGSKHKRLHGKNAQALDLLITQKGESYFWKSRDSRPLKYTQNGRFHYFVPDDGGAFIKIVEMRGSFHYAEGFTYSMISFILWGEGAVLNLNGTNQPTEPTAQRTPQ